jgi:hypothetical protein
MNRTFAFGRVRGLDDGADGNRVASKGLTAPRPTAGAKRTVKAGLRFEVVEGAMVVGCGAVRPSNDGEVLISLNARLPRPAQPQRRFTGAS